MKTDAPTFVLEYAIAKPTDLRRLMSIAAGCVLAVVSLAISIFTCWLTIQWSRANELSFGGCRVGRVGGLDLIVAGSLPAMTVIGAKLCRLMRFPIAYRVARLAAAASIGAYFVLWLDVVRALEYLKFELLK